VPAFPEVKNGNNYNRGISCWENTSGTKDAGADDSYKAPNLGYSVREFCSEGSISILFDEVFGIDGC
jgi:hypothetical protein